MPKILYLPGSPSFQQDGAPRCAMVLGSKTFAALDREVKPNSMSCKVTRFDSFTCLFMRWYETFCLFCSGFQTAQRRFAHPGLRHFQLEGEGKPVIAPWIFPDEIIK